MTTPDVLEGLNTAQREAVEHIEGPLLIIAGPGSGKTRVIAHRITYLVKVCGVSPHCIAAVTFTNKAAREMKGRLERLLGSRAEALTASTFHALCATILRRDGQHIGLDSTYAIYDDEDQIALVKRSMEEVGVDNQKLSPRAILSAISSAKSQLLDPEGYLLQGRSYFEEVVQRVYQRYQEMLHTSKAVDFDDLLMKVVVLVQRVPEVLHKYQNRYLHLLIDEFQDTNVAQYVLGKLLAGRHRNICVVGDPDQSIYSWRNADLRNVLSFQKDYPDAKIVSLEQNYRSTQTILDAAHHLIVVNRQRLEKDLWTENSSGVPIVVAEAFTEGEEAQQVVQEVERLTREEEYQLCDCAVMYRVNAQSRPFEETCLRYGLPYKLVGGVRFYQRKEVKDLIAYLRLLHNPYDEVSLARVVNVPSRGIGQRTVDELLRWAKSKDIPVYTALQTLAHEKEQDQPPTHPIAPRQTQALINFLRLLNDLMEDSKGMNVSQLLDAVVNRIGCQDYLREEERGEERWENVLEMKGMIQEYDHLNPEEGLQSFLERVALVSDQDVLDDGTQRDYLTLITLHQAKGLEFPVVFMVGMEEKVFPHSRSFDDPAEMEEERRLCYVGMTRAKERLYLWRAFRRRLFGTSQPNDPSRFLNDIPSHLVKGTAVDTAPIHSRAHDRWDGGTQAMAKAPSKEPFKAGDKVHHSMFGEGIVVNCAPSGTDHEVTVAFKGDSGIKRLLLSYAPLERVEKK